MARPFLDRAYAPYSGRSSVAIALLEDGSWVPGVRVENASFSLSLKASVNAVTAAVAAGRRDLVALATTDRVDDPAAYLDGVVGGTWVPVSAGMYVRDGLADLPDPRKALEMRVDVGRREPMNAARGLIGQALVPESDFPVACVADLGDGRGVPGVNVEHPDWTGIVCAERNALGTWVTLGRPATSALYLSCARDPWGTPCGACRQWLVELVPSATIWMDRGPAAPEPTLPGDLLPGAFTGGSLRSGRRGY